MKKLIATQDITLRLLQTGVQYSYKKDQVIEETGLLAERLIKQSKGIIIYQEEEQEEVKIQLFDLELSKKELEKMSKEKILESDYMNVLAEDVKNVEMTKKELIEAILEAMKQKNEA